MIELIVLIKRLIDLFTLWAIKNAKKNVFMGFPGRIIKDRKVVRKIYTIVTLQKNRTRLNTF